MFVKYEKSFKTILNYYYTTGNRTTSSRTFSIPRREIDYLAAKGLLDIVPYTNGDTDCRITISDKGITYFDEKRINIFLFWVPVIMSNLIAVASLVISILK